MVYCAGQLRLYFAIHNLHINKLVYYIFSYEFLNFEPWFDISSDGTISTVANNPVDREHINVNKVTNEYSLLVAAIDDCELIFLKDSYKYFIAIKKQ